MGRVERDADATRTREGGGGGFPHPPAPKSRARVGRLLTRAGRRSHRRAWPRPPTPRPPSRGARYTRTTPGGGARSPSPRAAPPTRAAATAPCAATRVNACSTCATVSYLRPGRAGSRRAATWNLKIPESVEFGPSRKLVTRSPRSFFPPPPPPFSRRPRELDASGGAPVRTRARRLCTNGLTNILLALFRSRRSLSPRRFGSADSGPSRSSRSSFYALAAPSSAIILALLRSSASLLSAAYSLLACSSAVGPISCGAVAASLA